MYIADLSSSSIERLQNARCQAKGGPPLMTYNRPWQSYSEQMGLLKHRGMHIGNESLALHQLEHIGYYRLSAYWYPFRSFEPPQKSESGRFSGVRSDLFEPNTHFDDAVNLYRFDKQLRLILMDALESIEIALRVDIAYLLGARNKFAHLDPTALHPSFAMKKSGRAGKTAFERWQEKFNGLLKRSKEDFVKHYRARHGTDLPIWVAIEIWDFGTVSQLLAMMKVADQQKVAEKYGVPDWRIFQSWLRSLNYLRNLIAHHSRLWNRNIVDQPKLPAPSQIQWCDTFVDRPDLLAKPFLLLAITLHMVDVITPDSTLPLRLRSHLKKFPSQHSACKLSVSDLGAPAHWEAWWLNHFSTGQIKTPA